MLKKRNRCAFVFSLADDESHNEDQLIGHDRL